LKLNFAENLFYALKDIINRVERKPMEVEKTFVDLIPIKEIIPKMHKEFLHFNKKNHK
jgi:hypothetical protein